MCSFKPPCNALSADCVALPAVSFGAGTGTVELVTDVDGGQTYIVFEMTLVPAEEFNRADNGVDGREDWENGRLRSDVAPVAGNTVTLRYFANVIN